MVLDTFFEGWKIDKKSKSLISDHIQREAIHGAILGIKPETFMNLSGDTVSALVSFYKLDPKKDILVISDDIDMEFGKIRYRKE